MNRFFCDHWIDSFWDVNWKQDGSTRWLDPRRRIHSRHISCMPRKWNAVYSLRHHSGELNGCRTESVNRSGCGVDSWGWLFTFSSPGISESILCGIDWRGNWKSGWRRHDLAHNAVQANWFEFWFADRRRSVYDPFDSCPVRNEWTKTNTDYFIWNKYSNPEFSAIYILKCKMGNMSSFHWYTQGSPAGGDIRIWTGQDMRKIAKRHGKDGVVWSHNRNRVSPKSLFTDSTLFYWEMEFEVGF